VQSVLHAHPPQIAGPANLLVHANRQLCRKHTGGFFTAFLALYEPESRRLTYAAAGHPPPVLKRNGDPSVRYLNAVSSYPLGINADECFEEAVIELRPGDTLLLFTDGITETRNPQRDMYDQPRLDEAFKTCRGTPRQHIVALEDAVKEFEAGRPPDDDQTLVVVKVS